MPNITVAQETAGDRPATAATDSAPQKTPTRARAGWPQAVVAGAYQTGVVLMRDLAKRGVSVCCIDCDRDNPGFRTVYGHAHLCPNPDDEPAAWLSFMKDLAEHVGGRPVLISSADQFVSAISRFCSELSKHYRFCDHAAELHARLATKQSQYELAELHGMPIARTQYVKSSGDALAFAATARFPCLLKPLHCRYWEALPACHPLHGKKVQIIAAAEEMAGKYRDAAEGTDELVVQEIIEGPDTAKVVYLSCYAGDGRRLGACMVRELRTFPIGFGSASVVEPVDDPEADALCDRFLQSIGYRGICEIELKRDTRDGRLKMIEANPRYSGTADAAPYAGVAIGWLHYLDLIGEHVEPVAPNGHDFRHITLCRDIPSLRGYRRAGALTWSQLLRSYRPPLAFYDFDLRDWRVTLSTLAFVTKVLLAPLYRRVWPKRRASNH